MRDPVHKIPSIELKTWLQYVIPLTAISFLLVTQQTSVETGGGYPVLYGFPLPCISGAWPVTLHHNIYIGPLLFDVLIYLLAWIAFITMVQWRGMRLRTNRLFILLNFLAIAGLIYYQLILLRGYNTYEWGYDVPFQAGCRAVHWGLYP